MINVIECFQELGKQAETELDQKYSVSEVEGIFLDMLNLIKENPQAHADFVSVIIDMLDEGNVPYEAIQFCMRELKWMDVKQGIIERLKKSDDPRVHTVMNNLLSVYEDSWDDADFYKYYS